MDFIHTHINAPSSSVLRAFPSYMDKVLEKSVGRVTAEGALYMSGIVPRGDSARLANAVSSSGPTSLPGRTVGTVFVDPILAPHADLVDRGTGVDGPYRQSVILKRPSKTKPGRDGVMSFQKNGEEKRARREVKFKHSLKIDRNKGFSQKTFDHMSDAAQAEVETIVNSSIPNYFRATGAR